MQKYIHKLKLESEQHPTMHQGIRTVGNDCNSFYCGGNDLIMCDSTAHVTTITNNV